MKEQKEQYGFTDEAAEEDQFGITDYIGGLAKFVEQCNTPLTMSIQGSWGTGKTSIMNLVKNQLSEEAVPIWFNTWQFSQFNMDNQLAVSLLSNLISEFNIQDKSTIQKADKLVKGLRVIAGAGIAYFDSKVDGMITGMTEVAKQNISDTSETDCMDPTVALSKLREQFAECVHKTLEEKNKKRIVIFIDDLDRLEPRKAVELLEVLKIFLDCKNCVFILAIDYDVVCRGVAAKYGSLSDDPREAAEKGKSFFDKIIQVPFKMPIARYNITGYVESCFSKIGVSFGSQSEIKVYEDLIKRSIGTNPRSMKRLFNAYQLLMIVVPNNLLSVAKNQQLLFAILCLQYCSEPIYNYLIRHADSLTVDIVNSMIEGKYDKFATLAEDVDEITDDDLVSAQPFMEKFGEAIDSDGENGIDESEINNFIQVLSFSAITAASDTEPVQKTIVDKYRIIHKKICRDLLDKLEDTYNGTYGFKDYYRRTHEKACWWTYIRQEQTSGGKIRFGYEMKLSPIAMEEKNMTSVVSIGIYKLDKEQNINEIIDVIGVDKFNELFGEPSEKTEWGIYYHNLLTFDTNQHSSKDEEIFKLFRDGFETIKQWFN